MRHDEEDMVTDFESQLRRLVVSIVGEVLAARDQRQEPRHVTVAEYARRLSVSERTVRDAIREGRLEHVRVGRAVRVPGDARIQPRLEPATERARLKLLGGR